MIQYLYYPFLITLLITGLLACSGMEQPGVRLDSASSQTAPVLMFAAWQLEAGRNPVAANSAVRELLGQADRLIDTNALEQASARLERLLRIEPAYAQAWSRLAWIALQNQAAERSRQMAYRSNSYAYDNTRLKALNWRFIRQASELMNDEAGVRDAEARIRQLGGGV